MHTLHQKSSIIIFNQYGIENQGIHKENKIYYILKPFYVLGEGLEYLYLKYDNVYTHFEEVVVIVFITYSFGLFVLLEILLEFRKTVILRRRRKKLYKDREKKKRTVLIS